MNLTINCENNNVLTFTGTEFDISQATYDNDMFYGTIILNSNANIQYTNRWHEVCNTFDDLIELKNIVSIVLDDKMYYIDWNDEDVNENSLQESELVGDKLYITFCEE